MFFSKIELCRDTEAVGRFAQSVDRDGYRLHQSLWDLFKCDGQQERDFLYRRMEERDWPCFYVVSARPPEDSIGVWKVQCKDYAPRLEAEQRLAFSLRANPVVTRLADRDAKRARHDVVMDAKKHQDEARKVPLRELVQAVGAEWLEKRAAKNGFRLEQFRVDSYRQHRFSKGKGNQTIRFRTLDFNGLLTVTDTHLFQRALCQGIGPAKGFGCGMLLVRRV